MLKTNYIAGVGAIAIIVFVLLLAESCKHDPEIIPLPDPPVPESCDTAGVSYPGTVVPILSTNCYGCHGDLTANAGINLQDYETLARLAQSGKLIGVINQASGFTAMPPFSKLDSCDIVKIEKWVNDTTFDSPGGGTGHPCDPDTVYFQNEVLPLIISSCATTDCHDKLTEEQEILLVDYASIIKYGKIRPGEPEESELYEKIIKTDDDDRMPPPPKAPLTSEQKDIIWIWIKQGALNNSCDEDCDTTNVTFSETIWPTIETNCFGCHSGPQPSGGVSLVDYTSVAAVANNGKLFGTINHDQGFVPMPRNAPKLSACKVEQVKIWIEDGTPNN